MIDENFATGEGSDDDDHAVVAEENDSGTVPTNPSSPRITSGFLFDYFWGKLVEYFDMLFKQKNSLAKIN